ncbi:undecaprenyl-diphosphate phosphatase [Treponema sp.]|uniref:undecaprenyl-diphosphate phosphatase n=1 Tax=Treponema sp. TaxID=166 RepID=UPI0025E2D036|nr:undecaprenyl-diphosphate phosphatase [Treponema sp.]MCR5218475.1 undecaprenyl-diphosphate phosphatase [Treponema sp.]
MSVLQGIFLGLIQGIAEFLPISSSAHLKIAQHLFGLDEVPLLFDVMLHLATLCSVFLFFRKKILELLLSFFRIITFKKSSSLAPEEAAKETQNRKMILAVILATLVTGVIGIFTSKLLNDDLISLKIVSAGFLVTSFLLISSAKIEKLTINKSPVPSWPKALLIGLAQGFGTLPGISRSGSTIAGALYCKIDRVNAGEFSFILSIPAILGAFILEAKDLSAVKESIGMLPLAAGCLTAFVSGLLALAFLMRLIKKGKLEWFAAYLIPLGICGIIFF